MASDAEKELDLPAIKTQYETEIAHQEYWGQDYGTLNKAQDMIEKLIAEVERLRDEVTQGNKILDKYVEEFGYINSLWSE